MQDEATQHGEHQSPLAPRACRHCQLQHAPRDSRPDLVSKSVQRNLVDVSSAEEIYKPHNCATSSNAASPATTNIVVKNGWSHACLDNVGCATPVCWHNLAHAALQPYVRLIRNTPTCPSSSVMSSDGNPIQVVVLQAAVDNSKYSSPCFRPRT